MQKVLEERKALGLRIAELTKAITNGEKAMCPNCNKGFFLQQSQSNTYYCSYCKKKLVIDLDRQM